ncbi:ABC transporter substrate-binding protein [Acidisphaera sp. L21]|uniref:ABC transporter substrate-binding protein n=1 Tax=Acidisphaera sp. L21 TaxID=1641851 RepID=UPI00131B1BC5|nr:ABC transporter substrate-binding protein [Acidisphaera sp. L21]
MTLTRRAAIGAAIGSVVALPAIRPARAASNVLRVGIGTSLSRLDPLLTTIGDEYIYDNLVFNGLTRMAEDLTTQPDLAEKWEYGTDLKSWTFHLRQGVKYHDGSIMVAADVVAMFKRLMDPATTAPSRSNYDMITGVEAPDDHTVVFTLSYPYGGFADIMTDRQVKIVPRGKVDQLATKPIGTGPFKFVSYTPGDRLILAKHTEYFEPGMPKLEGVELRIIPEMSSKLAALQSGELDVVWDLPLEQVKTLAARNDLRVESVPSGSWDAAIMNNLIPPFNNPLVRAAFQLGVDKADVVELTLFGQGAPTISMIPPTHPFYAKTVKIAATDPAAAKKMLAQAGYPNGVSVPIIVPVGRPVRERLGVTLQQLAKPAGFDLQVQRVSYSSFDAEVSGKAPLYIDGYFARPTIDTSTFPFLHTTGSWNSRLWHYKNAKVDEALAAGRLAGDPAEQSKHYIAMQEALNADPAGYIAYSVNFACAYRKSVTGVKTHPMRWFDLRTTVVA